MRAHGLLMIFMTPCGVLATASLPEMRLVRKVYFLTCVWKGGEKGQPVPTKAFQQPSPRHGLAELTHLPLCHLSAHAEPISNDITGSDIIKLKVSYCQMYCVSALSLHTEHLTHKQEEAYSFCVLTPCSTGCVYCVGS